MKKRTYKDTQKNGAKAFTDSVITVVTLLFSFIVSLVTAIVSIEVEFTAFETVSTTLLTFLCSEYFVNKCILQSKYIRGKKERKYWDKVNEYSEKLEEINDYCTEILGDSHGDKDLFVVTCSKAIDNLYYLMRQAALEKRIEITSDYIVNSLGVFDALNITNDKQIELTFPLDEITPRLIETAEDRKFFETCYKMVTSKKVNCIRVLLILKDFTLLHDKKLKMLLQFYASVQGYECRYILKEDFCNACEHNMIQTTYLDFGIYGPQMLFRVEEYDPYCGIYSKSETEVKRYSALFNEVWNFESITHKNPENAVMPALNPGEFFGKIDRMSDVSAMPTTDSVSSPITSSEGTTVGIQRAAGEQVDQEVVEEESISEECVFAENVESNIEEQRVLR